jgi:hypothetical protein
MFHEEEHLYVFPTRPGGCQILGIHWMACFLEEWKGAVTYTVSTPAYDLSLDQNQDSVNNCFRFSNKKIIRGQLCGAQGLRLSKWRHFVLRQFGVPTDHIFWHTCCIFWHTCLTSNSQIFKFLKSVHFIRRNQIVKKMSFHTNAS